MQRSDKQSNVLFSRYSGKAISIARAVRLLRVAAARAPGKKQEKGKFALFLGSKIECARPLWSFVTHQLGGARLNADCERAARWRVR